MRSNRSQQFRGFVLRATGTVLPAAVLFMAAGASAQDPSQVGEWSNVQDWPLQTIHAVLTNQGEVLVWGDGLCNSIPQDPDDEDTRVWDPQSDAFTLVPTGVDFFCGGHANLANGSHLVVGGGCNDSFNNKAMIFTPNGGPNGPWEQVQPMNYVRWYPTLTTLPDGRILSISGKDGNNDIVPIPEVYDPDTDTWTSLDGADIGNTPIDHDMYPQMFVAPDGRVYGRPHAPNALSRVSGCRHRNMERFHCRPGFW